MVHIRVEFEREIIPYRVEKMVVFKEFIFGFLRGLLNGWKIDATELVVGRKGDDRGVEESNLKFSSKIISSVYIYVNNGRHVLYIIDSMTVYV